MFYKEYIYCYYLDFWVAKKTMDFKTIDLTIDFTITNFIRTEKAHIPGSDFQMSYGLCPNLVFLG